MDNEPGAEGGAGEEGQDQADRKRSDAGPVLNYTITGERDVLIVANQLIKRYGDQALLRAATRHLELWNEGAFTGAMVWNRIYNAILDSQHPELIEGPTAAEQH